MTLVCLKSIGSSADSLMEMQKSILHAIQFLKSSTLQ